MPPLKFHSGFFTPTLDKEPQKQPHKYTVVSTYGAPDKNKFNQFFSTTYILLSSKNAINTPFLYVTARIEMINFCTSFYYSWIFLGFFPYEYRENTNSSAIIKILRKGGVFTNTSLKLGTLLRAQRKLQGLTIEQLAEKCGVSSRCIGNIELNKSLPKADTFITICRELNITHFTYFSELYPKYED